MNVNDVISLFNKLNLCHCDIQKPIIKKLTISDPR